MACDVKNSKLCCSSGVLKCNAGARVRGDGERLCLSIEDVGDSFPLIVDAVGGVGGFGAGGRKFGS